MAIFSKIIEYLQNIKNLKTTRFSVVSTDQEKLKDYHDSLGWYLDKLGEQGKLPQGVIHLSTVGTTGKRIIVYYDSREVSKSEVVNFLKAIGVRVTI